jgi:hypothetical protein
MNLHSYAPEWRQIPFGQEREETLSQICLEPATIKRLRRVTVPLGVIHRGVVLRNGQPQLGAHPPVPGNFKRRHPQSGLIEDGLHYFE